MPINRNALIRMRTIDACLRRRQRLWTIEDLQEACEDALYEYEGVGDISIRTIRRDIQLMRSDKLGYNAPIIVKDKKYYSYEDPDFSITNLPLTDDDIAELSSALDIIRHYGTFSGLAGQEDIITRLQDRIVAQGEHHQVVYIETNKQLKGLNFLGPLYDYIVKRQSIEVVYHSFKSADEMTYKVSPYILKEFNNRWFLICYETMRKMVMTLALDRIVSVSEDRLRVYVENRFFDPDTYFNEMVGVTRSLKDRPILIRLKVDASTAPYLITKPLHHTQRIVRSNEDGSIEITMLLIINREFERLLLGFCHHIEVIHPRRLRTHIAAQLTQATNIYHPEK